MFVLSTVWTFKPGAIDAVLRLDDELFVPLAQQQPGFISFSAARVGRDVKATWLVFDTQAHGEAARDALQPALRERVEDAIEGIERHAGELIVNVRTPEAVTA
jgi:hypothetical protein